LKATIHFDGSCEPRNPGGNARGGWTIKLQNGRSFSGSKFIASDSTNNVAEFGALRFALEHAVQVGATEFEILGDSKLVIECLNGEWMVRKHHLFKILRRIRRTLLGRLWTARWIPRAQNAQADFLSTHTFSPSPADAVDPDYDRCDDGSPDGAAADYDPAEEFDSRFGYPRGASSDAPPPLKSSVDGGHALALHPAGGEQSSHMK